MRIGLVVLLLVILAGLLLQPVVADLETQGEEQTLQAGSGACETFTQENALQDLGRLHGVFDAMKNIAEEQTPDTAISGSAEFEHAELQEQALAFSKGLSSVEGALYRQQYELRKTQYELAKERAAKGAISPAEVQRAKVAFEQSEKAMHEFWERYHAAE